MEYLKPYLCPHCLKKNKEIIYVVMKTQTNNILPIEIKKGEKVSTDEIFDYKKRRSHLLDCEERRLDWNFARKDFESGKRPTYVIETESFNREAAADISPEEKEKRIKEKKFQEILRRELEWKKI